jgi:hypothetical protein
MDYPYFREFALKEDVVLPELAHLLERELIKHELLPVEVVVVVAVLVDVRFRVGKCNGMRTDGCLHCELKLVDPLKCLLLYLGYAIIEFCMSLAGGLTFAQ